ncbi:hypothetical protein [Lapillicoccus jejuensis]|uniref:hypothetical protein n=1 Tax=Lapillicoccus jejuensis TaxID=402171 RepID=UPI001151B90F|nr:hypothetical protein [Lapillicoccus jejuensis]
MLLAMDIHLTSRTSNTWGAGRRGRLRRRDASRVRQPQKRVITEAELRGLDGGVARFLRDGVVGGDLTTSLAGLRDGRCTVEWLDEPERSARRRDLGLT